MFQTAAFQKYKNNSASARTCYPRFAPSAYERGFYRAAEERPAETANTELTNQTRFLRGREGGATPVSPEQKTSVRRGPESSCGGSVTSRARTGGAHASVGKQCGKTTKGWITVNGHGTGCARQRVPGLAASCTRSENKSGDYESTIGSAVRRSEKPGEISCRGFSMAALPRRPISTGRLQSVVIAQISLLRA